MHYPFHYLHFTAQRMLATVTASLRRAALTSTHRAPLACAALQSAAMAGSSAHAAAPGPPGGGGTDAATRGMATLGVYQPELIGMDGV